GQAYWLQPSLINQSGTQVWLSAQVYQPPPPVERKPATLVQKSTGDLPLILERWSTLHFPDPTGRDHRVLINQETHLTDTVKGRQDNDLSLSRRYTGFKEGIGYDGETYMTRRLQHLGPNIQFLMGSRVVDAQGTTTRDDIDSNKIQEGPLPA